MNEITAVLKFSHQFAKLHKILLIFIGRNDIKINIHIVAQPLSPQLANKNVKNFNKTFN
jgi:hypothetical protein